VGPGINDTALDYSQGGVRVKDNRCTGKLGNGRWVGFAGFYSCIGPDANDFQFRFLAESPTLLSVTHMVSAECVTSLLAYFRFWMKLKLPRLVDL